MKPFLGEKRKLGESLPKKPISFPHGGPGVNERF
jgi:hypothetical protein